MKKIGVALLGLGVVGGGTYEILTKKREEIKESQGVDIEIKRILEKNTDRCLQLGVDMSKVTQNFDDILGDDQIEIVAEFFGGVEPARSFLVKALEKGKNVVTANKEMFSKCWQDLESAAEKSGAGIYFEASCMGGVPVIRALQESAQANSVLSMTGIVNGTTNYILTRMSDENMDYKTCLEQAQASGYAEANPTADAEGFDSTYKISILSSLAYRKRVPVDKVYREGISDVSPIDIEIGKKLGYTLKLLAISKNKDGETECRVHPTFLKNDHPLANVKGVFNAILIKGDNAGDIMLYGQGAGALPTGSAIVSDIVYCARTGAHRRFPWQTKESCDGRFVSDFETKYYLRLSAESGAIKEVAKVFEKYAVGLEYISQSECGDRAETVAITKIAKESVMKAITNDIKQLARVNDVCSMIRVEE